MKTRDRKPSSTVLFDKLVNNLSSLNESGNNYKHGLTPYLEQHNGGGADLPTHGTKTNTQPNQNSRKNNRLSTRQK